MSFRRQARAQEFGRRHPRLTLAIVCLVLAGVITGCAVQIGHGTYLGHGWLIAAVAGIAGAAVLSAAAVIRNLRHGTDLSRFELVWMVLGMLSVSAIRIPFPRDRYGSVQAFFNVVHAALLGYAVVTYTLLVALLTFVIIRPRGLPGLLVLRQPTGPAAGRYGLQEDTGQSPRRQTPRALGWPAWVLAVAVAGLVAGVILAVANGPRRHDVASTTAGSIILVALAAIGVAVPAALYRRFRSRRAADPTVQPGDWPGQDPASQ